jgi:hypothetical protein
MVFNPQFSGAGIIGNPSNSVYHSFEVKFNKRYSWGFTNQTSYTWSKTIGSQTGTRDPRNRNLDRSVETFHRPHVMTSNGTYSMPFGPGRALLADAPGWVQRIVEQWQLGGLMRWSSGGPLTFSSGLSTIDGGSATPHQLGPIPEGKLVKNTDGTLPNYFKGLVSVSGTADPTRARVTTVDTLQSAYSNRAIADANGNIIMINPQPGETGSMGLRTFHGPARFELDMNLVKKVQLTEANSLEFRADVVNVLNHPVFGNPNVSINSSGSFGQISSASNGRRFTLGARFNFGF